MTSPNTKSCNPQKNAITFTKLQKRNKITIIVLTSFLITLTLITGALMTYLSHSNTWLSENSAPFNSPMLFYTGPCRAQPCWRVQNTIINTKYIFEPDRVFNLVLQKLSQDLEDIISLINGGPSVQMRGESHHMNVSDDGDKNQTALQNCVDSLRNGSGQIGSVFQISPFLGMQNGEQRGQTIKRIMAAEENLDACARSLENDVHEWTAAIRLKEKVLRVKLHLRSSRENFFTDEYDDVWIKFWNDFVAKWRMTYGGAFLLCVGGMQLLFMFFLVWTRFKFCCR
ncbi:peptide chain release factor 3 [Striga asiatica]|uniref:Peptide chain release factor 3 n=1 Tax=Striga asiatica TaxID=4170 RepID=A0A5A7QY03_STRAF|nr:peptide chain release factor 3 [Striga asiatica]